MEGKHRGRLHISPLPYLLGPRWRTAHRLSITITASPVTCPGLCQGRSPVGADKLPSTPFPSCLSDTSSRKIKCITQECPPSSILEDLPLKPLFPLSAHMPVPLPGTPFCSFLNSDFLVAPQLSISLLGLQVLPLSFWHTCVLPHPGSALLPVLGKGPVPSRQRRCEESYLSQPQGC